MVRPAGWQVPQAPPAVMPWQKELVKAWMMYCQAMPRGQRSFTGFIAGLPKAGEKGMPVPPSSPDAVPMDPDKSPSPLRGRGKRRKDDDDEAGITLEEYLQRNKKKKKRRKSLGESFSDENDF